MRGALMLTLDINHPDVLDFIKVKRDSISVTGANISIKLNKKFKKAVENDEDYILRFPCDATEGVIIQGEGLEYNKLHIPLPLPNRHKNKGKLIQYCKRIKAREYWDEIIESAKSWAEPGLIYFDTVLDNDPASVYTRFRPQNPNPCGEQFLNPYDSCRLMALNLFSVIDKPFTKDASINMEKLYKLSYEFTRLGDDLVDLEQEYILRIIEKIKSDPEPIEIKQPELTLWEKAYDNVGAGRRMGLGITALADMLAAMNIPYSSDKALKVIGTVMKTKMEAELDCLIDLSISRGPFEGWSKDLEFIFNDAGEVYKGKNSFYNTLLAEFPEQVERMVKYGRRSINWSTIAPTGSVSILSQTTSGLEPLFMPFYMRRKKVNPGENVKVDFVDEIGDSWQEFPILHQKFKEWILSNNSGNLEGHINKLGGKQLQQLFKQSPWYGSTANDIDWKKRVDIQAILQKYTTNAISSTINLPSTVTNKEVSEIYIYGWTKGLKGQTIYVDGSRSGVLVSNEGKSTSKFDYKDAMKRPKELDCDIHITTHAGQKYNVIVGLLEDKPYEVFVVAHFTNEKSMQLIKVKSGRYDLVKKGKTYSEDITTEMTDEQQAITRLVSTNLRHRVNIKYVVEQLNKTATIFGFNKSLARVIKKYIPEGVKSTVKCTECGSSNVVFEEGCNKCLDCGHSACS